MARKGRCFWQYFFLLGREEFQWRTSFILIPESLWDTQLLWLQSIVMSQPGIITSTVTWKWKCVKKWWTKNDPDGAEAVEKSCKSTLNVSFVLGFQPLCFGAMRMVRFGSRSWPHCTRELISKEHLMTVQIIFETCCYDGQTKCFKLCQNICNHSKWYYQSLAFNFELYSRGFHCSWLWILSIPEDYIWKEKTFSFYLKKIISALNLVY